MTPITFPDDTETFIYTTRRNTLVIVENGTVQISDAGTGEIYLQLEDFEEILLALGRDGGLRHQSNPRRRAK